MSEFDIGPENLESGLRRLDIMMADWNGSGVRIGYANADISDSSLDQDSNVPDWCVRAILVNLALQIAPMFGKQMTREVKVTANEAYETVLARTGNEDPLTMDMPQSLPRGAGHKTYRYGNASPFFPTPDQNIEAGPDGELDFY